MNSIGFQENQERRAVSDHDAYFNAASLPGADVLRLEPGEVLFGDDANQMIVASVGAGVLVSVYDVDMHFGACGYILMPDDVLAGFPNLDQVDPALLRKAFEPLEECIGVMKRNGASKGRIRMRLHGGAQIQTDPMDKGTKNYVFVREYLTRKGLLVMNEDLGGRYVRRIHFFPATGRSVRWVLRRDGDFEDILALETQFQQKIASTS